MIIEKKNESSVTKLILGMSVYGNFKRLINVDRIEGQLDCLHGLRFLSMGWVVLGHLLIDILSNMGLKIKNFPKFYSSKF